MRPVYITADNIITSLGFNTSENVRSIQNNVIGLKQIEDPSLYPSPITLSRVNTPELELRFSEVLQKHQKNTAPVSYTRLEKILLVSISDVLSASNINLWNKRTLFVLSTTKGNIDLLEERYKAQFNHRRIFLWELARVIGAFFGFTLPPVVISNACISGILALITASRFIQSGLVDHAVVAGGDIASEFVITGFQSFQAISPAPCKPFDLHRTGLSLGEGAGAMILSAFPKPSVIDQITIAGAATTNDANHISGPSRTGEELGIAIKKAMAAANLTPADIQYISAHGTATSYNDEMESKAIAWCDLTKVPVNSFKGYWGHTLGAAGLIESVAAIESLKTNQLFVSAGYHECGVPVPINVITKCETKPLKHALKMASGFGGCNAAIIYQKS
ncbi:MAG: beta-ketoacyl synthase N-terminal-like domain-containing protein [Bacteroidales bacterium]|nr:hypothetical protein [Bacteroidales bacterium]MDD4603265.1 beta-ketoacyl synthase N-terminal-like domain-containing protein [Bacteroidales bacterium]